MGTLDRVWLLFPIVLTNSILLGRELIGLNLVNLLIRNLECSGENVVRHLTGSLEEHHGDKTDTESAVGGED